MFALSDARDYSFSKVPYLEREEEIADQSNFVNIEALNASYMFQPLMSFWINIMIIIAGNECALYGEGQKRQWSKR